MSSYNIKTPVRGDNFSKKNSGLSYYTIWVLRADAVWYRALGLCSRRLWDFVIPRPRLFFSIPFSAMLSLFAHMIMRTPRHCLVALTSARPKITLIVCRTFDDSRSGGHARSLIGISAVTEIARWICPTDAVQKHMAGQQVA